MSPISRAMMPGLYHRPPSSPVLDVSLLPCPAMMPGQGSVPSSSIFSCLGRLPPPLSSYDARSVPSSSIFSCLGRLPPPLSSYDARSVPSSSIFSCLGRLLPPLSSNNARSGFCTILLHLLLSWRSPSSLVRLGCRVRVLYHPPPSSPVLAVSFVPCPARMPGRGSVPSSSNLLLPWTISFPPCPASFKVQVLSSCSCLSTLPFSLLPLTPSSASPYFLHPTVECVHTSATWLTSLSM